MALKYRQPFDHNHHIPTGQAALWYEAVLSDPYVPLSGLLVARQIARLCGDDSKVLIPWRSLADAVGRVNRAGNLRSYTETGAECLVGAGWLDIVTIGEKRGAKTTFYLLPGDPSDGYEVGLGIGELVA